MLLSKRHERFKNKMIDWNNLIMGFGSQKDREEYYNCDYNCPESKDQLLKTLEKTKGF